MKLSLCAFLFGSSLVAACGGVEVPTPEDREVRGVNDAQGDTGAEGLGDDPAATGAAGEGENDPGELAAAHGIFANGSTVETTANLNLRATASAQGSILRTMPQGSTLVVVNGTASNGFIEVAHNGLQGFAAYRYLQAAGGASSGGTQTGSSDRDEALALAKTAVGFSYWWGFGTWQESGATASNKGSCSGDCPDCSHRGTYGADCSGYLAKVWKVPSTNTNVGVNSHPYSTADFYGGSGGGQWAPVSRSALQPADILVYRSGGAGHMAMYDKGDAWGAAWTYEARGCSYGITHSIRSFGSGFRGIKRSGW